MRGLIHWGLALAGSVVFAGCVEEPPPFAKLSIEPPGEHCASGGTRITVGIDRDGDGMLREDEIASTSFLCNRGDRPRERLEPLFILSDAPPQEGCASGGQRLEVGFDRNGDGLLDDSEITSTEFVCNDAAFEKIHYGDLWIYSDFDLANLSRYLIVTGDVSLRFPGGYKEEQLVASGVRYIGGEIWIYNCANASQSNLDQVSVEFLDLEHVTGAFSVQGSCERPAMSELSLPKLRHGGQFFIAETQLEELVLPSLESTTFMNISNNARLKTVEMPKIESASSINVWNNAALVDFKAPLVEEVSTLKFEQNEKLRRVSLPSLVWLIGLDVVGNHELELFDIRRAHPSWSVRFFDNPSLSDCVPFDLAGGLLLQKFGTEGSDVMENGGVPCEDAELLCPALRPLGVSANYRGCVFAPSQGFDDARALCQELGEDYDLVSFASADEFEAFSSAEMNAHHALEFWIGYRSPLGESGWSWLDGSPFTPEDDGAFWRYRPSEYEDADLCARYGEDERVSAVSCGDGASLALCRAQ